MNGIKTLMNRMIDYAGLFPPAKLPLDQAIRNYAAYREGPFAWMLARFICPAARMHELDAYSNGLFREGAGGMWRFSALGRSGNDTESFLVGLQADVVAMGELAANNDGRVTADALETRLPESLVAAGDREGVRELVDRAVDQGVCLRTLRSNEGLRVFFEIPFIGKWRSNTQAVITAVAQHNQARSSGDGARSVGVKIRTGGVQASQIPSIEQVAFFLHCCREHSVPFKATAGLHHPVRHHSAEVDAPMHGFLNVFAAAVASHTLAIPESTVCAMLAEESPDSFALDIDGLSWREHRVSVEEIALARRDFAISFGSCSLMEPVEDLQRLGLL